jgi:hypothetical protein
MGFRSVGFPPACHPATGFPILTPAGLTPAGHISLFWTHNRTGCFYSIRLSSPRLFRTSGEVVSQIVQTDTVVFSFVDLLMAWPADGDLLAI